jgi:hypothetical protein
VAAAFAAAALVGGAVYLAGAGSSGPEPSRPVRALGAIGDADPALAKAGPGEPAAPVPGDVALPHRSRPLRAVVSLDLRTVPWVKQELSAEAEAEAEGAAGAGGAGTDGYEAEDEAEGAETGETKLDLGDTEGVTGQTDAALQTARGATMIPAPLLNFNGLTANANPYRLVPPDANGDVGSGYFVQLVNTQVAVYNSATGTKLAGPTLMSTLFDEGTQKLCATHDDGDPVVVFDEYADRWVISQFGLNFRRLKFAECIAVSTSDDPTSTWNAYQFDYPKAGAFNDYPKFGVWRDGYYASFNQFDGRTFRWKGGGAIAYDRDAMLLGDPAGQIYVDLFNVRHDLGGMLPSDADGPNLPPPGTPNYFLMFDADEPGWGYQDDQIEVWEFHADFGTPANSTFIEQGVLPTANFSPWICGKGRFYCVPQKRSTRKLDTLSANLMFRLQYRNFGGGDQRMVASHSVRAGRGVAGIRWYEFTNGGTDGDPWAIADQGTYAPGARKSRWMGSAAMDEEGNIAMGYSLSSGKLYPSIAVAGRLAGDPTGTLGQAERKVFTGKGSEKGKYGRWGDYADMTVDDTDGCTFYFTTQYYKKTGQWKWATRIVSFQMPGCA